MLNNLKGPHGKVEVGGIVALVAGLLGGIRAWLGLAVGAVAIALMIWGFMQKRKRNDTVKELVSTALEDSRGALDRVLFHVGKRLNVGEGNNTWRVSLYELDSADRAWKRLGRACPNELWAGGGRESFPVTEGVLRDAVAGSERTDGRTEVTPEFPPRLEDPEGWLSSQEAWGIQRDVAASLRFPARRYVARVCWVDQGDGHGRTFAILTECTDPTSLTKDHLERMVPASLIEAIASMMWSRESLEGVLADPRLDLFND